MKKNCISNDERTTMLQLQKEAIADAIRTLKHLADDSACDSVHAAAEEVEIMTKRSHTTRFTLEDCDDIEKCLDVLAAACSVAKLQMQARKVSLQKNDRLKQLKEMK